MHGSSEVEDSQEHSGQEVGQAAAKALEPRTALIHGWREVMQGMRWVAERLRFMASAWVAWSRSGRGCRRFR